MSGDTRFSSVFQVVEVSVTKLRGNFIHWRIDAWGCTPQQISVVAFPISSSSLRGTSQNGNGQFTHRETMTEVLRFTKIQFESYL